MGENLPPQFKGCVLFYGHDYLIELQEMCDTLPLTVENELRKISQKNAVEQNIEGIKTYWPGMIKCSTLMQAESDPSY